MTALRALAPVPFALGLATIALLVSAPFAAAEYYEGKPACPPGMMCTLSDTPPYEVVDQQPAAGEADATAPPSPNVDASPKPRAAPGGTSPLLLLGLLGIVVAGLVALPRRS